MGRKQPETRLQQKIQKRLNATVGGWWFKVWGGPFQVAGVPDLIGCVEGMFFALEVKLPKSSSKPSLIQLEVIRDIVWKGGGVATIVRSEDEAEEVVRRALAEAARGSRVCVVERRSRAAMRAANGEDLHHPSTNRGADVARALRRRPGGRPQ